MDDLFSWQPDSCKRLCDEAPTRLAARRVLYAESCFFFTLNLCTVYGGSITQLIVVQGGKTWKSIRQKEFIPVLGFPKVPAHLAEWQNLVSYVVAHAL